MIIRKLLLTLVLFPSSIGFASESSLSLNLTKGVTNISGQVYDLHMMILYICIVIGIVVFGAMLWVIIYHRKSRGAVAANFHESTKVEVIWTLIPIVILVGMAIPASRVLLAMEDTSEPDITVQVTGSQWKWHYRYFDQDINYFSLLASSPAQIYGKHKKRENYLLEVDRPLVLPIGKKIRFLITSEDVIHSWWVPAFAVKKDANPGFINEAWTKIDKPGIYRGQCAELCGKAHGFMPIVVIAKSSEEFDVWVKETVSVQARIREEEQKSLGIDMGMNELMALGEEVYKSHCSGCHQVNGLGLSSMFPALANSDIVVNPDRLMDHLNIVIFGKEGTAMQAFGSQLGLKELAAVITYERNAWGNNTNDTIQIADINAILKGSGL
ncbi:cytochrome c oxidase subunit II [Candidatus Enterovibrio escicola]|uniref:Cytochrome c oxidase subunit 2 n=1 Tax=Candidatus Enterovibrio escicola TaxID=1927127 RepID=A0A2A5T4Z4_9GAMM|nr:cytochrome c oxidase subunit II [Candidatus Enterovibrio escacola]PCS23218.1 Cytochrome c oxidase polypeptide II [Candidatus Enterovibrio escacola]